MLLSPRKDGLHSLFKEVRVFKEFQASNSPRLFLCGILKVKIEFLSKIENFKRDWEFQARLKSSAEIGVVVQNSGP